MWLVASTLHGTDRYGTQQKVPLGSAIWRVYIFYISCFPVAHTGLPSPHPGLMHDDGPFSDFEALTFKSSSLCSGSVGAHREHQRLFSSGSDLGSRLVYLCRPQGCHTCGGTGCALCNSRGAHRHSVTSFNPRKLGGRWYHYHPPHFL